MTLPIGPKSGGAAGGSEDDDDPRARIRKARQRLAAGKTRLFVIPGYDTDNPELGGGQVVARYRRMGDDERREILVTKAADKKVVEINAQFLSEACVEILFRTVGGMRPLVPGEVTRYTVNVETGESFATFTGVEDEPTLTAQMVAAFGDNELSLNHHSGEVDRWMTSANIADGEIALGEL